MAKQKLDEKSVANALAIITAITYIICIVLLWITPNLAINLGNYFMHGIDITSIIANRGIGYSLMSLVLGTVSAWIFGYLFALFYNKF